MYLQFSTMIGALLRRSTPLAACSGAPQLLVWPRAGAGYSSPSYDAATADPAPVMPFPEEVAKEELDKVPDAPPIEEQVQAADARDALHPDNSSAAAEAQRAVRSGKVSDVVSGEAEERVKVLNAEQDQQRQEDWDQAGAGDKVAAGAKAVKGKVMSGYNKVADAVGDGVSSLNDARDRVTPQDP